MAEERASSEIKGPEEVAEPPSPKRARQAEKLPDEAIGYVVSISRKNARRCLHYVGRCPRVPYVHYKEAEELGPRLPPPHLYSAVCKECWPGAVATEVSEVEEVIPEDEFVNSADEASSESDDDLSAPL